MVIITDLKLGWTYYDILRSLPKDKKIDVLKQEWIVERKDGFEVRLISASKLYDFPDDKHWLVGKNYNFKWLTVEKFPHTWRIVPVNSETCNSS